MQRGPGGQPALPAALNSAAVGAAPVQPDDQTLDERRSPDPLLTRWLEEHERDSEAERLERLLADRDLVTRLEYSGYAEAEWEQVATEFARYGLSVIQSWITKGTIFGKLREKRLGGLPEAPAEWFDPVAVSDLATDTVVAALGWFKDNVLIKHQWNPERPGGAASLKTFFVGQCLFQFRSVYRQWHREESSRRRHVIAAKPEDPEFLHRPGVERADRAILAHEEATQALAQINGDHARQAFVMDAAGMTHAEIAAELQLPDEKAVENVLCWQRRRLRRRAEGAA
jgi:DNA-directed RNA polymerase specialized sigma24 family protein